MPIIQTNSGYGYVYRKSGKQKRKVPPFFKMILILSFIALCVGLSLFASTKIPSLVGINTANMFNTKKLYAISVGSFNDYSSASILSETILKQGGAGKVIKNGNEYIVLLSCYETEKDANNVIINLSDSGVEASIFELTLNGLNLKVDIDYDKKVILKNSINLFYDSYKDLYELSINYDNKTLTKVEALEEINRLIDKVNKVYTQFNASVRSAINATGVYLQIFISELIDSLTNLSNCQENFSGQIKSTYFEALNLYINFRQEIGN